MPCGAAGVRTPDRGRLAPFIPRLVARFGKKNLYQYCGLFTVAGGVALFLTPAGMPLPALLFVAVKGFGVQLINTLMFALEADTVEYGEWQTGRRTEGATYAIFSFTRKITQSIGGALGASRSRPGADPRDRLRQIPLSRQAVPTLPAPAPRRSDDRPPAHTVMAILPRTVPASSCRMASGACANG